MDWKTITLPLTATTPILSFDNDGDGDDNDDDGDDNDDDGDDNDGVSNYCKLYCQVSFSFPPAHWMALSARCRCFFFPQRKRAFWAVCVECLRLCEIHKKCR